MRCPTHDLALGPDGACVLCRRETAPPPSRISRAALAGVALIGVSALALIAYGIVRQAAREVVRTPAPIAPSAEPAMPQEIVSEFRPAEPEEERAPASSEVPKIAPAPVAAAPAVSAQAEPKRPAAPTEADLRAALREVPITIYTTSWCPHCSRARSWLQSNSIRFEEHDIEAEPSAKQKARALNPRGGVPTIDVDGTVLVGFSSEQVGKAIAASVQRRLRARAAQ